MRIFNTASTILRQKGFAKLLSHIHLILLRRGHEILWDRKYNAYEAVSTGGYLLSEELDPIDETNHTDLINYLPTPRLVVKWLLNGLDLDFGNFSFVDIGSGRGRVLLAAAEKPFIQVEGVEYSRVLHREAKENITNYPSEKLKCKNLNSVCQDAGKYIYPDGNCILFLFNPFEPQLLEQVIRNAVDRAKACNSRFVFVYYNPVYVDVFEDQDDLEEIELSFLSKLKMKLLAPYPARIFVCGR